MCCKLLWYSQSIWKGDNETQIERFSGFPTNLVMWGLISTCQRLQLAFGLIIRCKILELSESQNKISANDKILILTLPLRNPPLSGRSRAAVNKEQIDVLRKHLFIWPEL